MKAAVLWQRGSRLAIETAEIGPPRPGEARVRVVASAVCHSDLVQIRRETRHVPPLVLGHESAGVVESLGEGVTRVRPGDRVSIAFGVHCGECFYCLRRQSHLCEAATPVWSHLRSRGQLLKPLYGVGGFAEYANVDARNLVVVPEAVPMVCAALISCGVATGVGAVLNSARVEAGASIAVIGVGGVGINVVQAARLVGAARVIAVDLIDQKLEWAREFGATHAVNASRCDPVRAIRELTEGRGVDYAFEAVGTARTVEQAYEAIRKGGAALIVGMAPGDVAIRISPLEMMASAKTLRGCTYGGCLHPAYDLQRCIDLYLGGHLKLDALVGRQLPLEQVNDAILELESGAIGRSVIVLQ